MFLPDHGAFLWPEATGKLKLMKTSFVTSVREKADADFVVNSTDAKSTVS